MAEQKGCYGPIRLGTREDAGIINAIANPEGAGVVITRAFVNITTETGEAARELDVGVAADAVTTSDTIFDGIDPNAAAALHDSMAPLGAGEENARIWGANQWVNANVNNNNTGMVADLYIQYIRL